MNAFVRLAALARRRLEFPPADAHAAFAARAQRVGAAAVACVVG